MKNGWFECAHDDDGPAGLFHDGSKEQVTDTDGQSRCWPGVTVTTCSGSGVDRDSGEQGLPAVQCVLCCVGTSRGTGAARNAWGASSVNNSEALSGLALDPILPGQVVLAPKQ